MRILITGASGFIGTNLTKELSGSHKVGVIIRPNSTLAKGLTDQITGAYTYDGSLDSVKQAFEAFKPEMVIHLASYYVYDHKPEEIDTLIESNIKIGAYILEAMKLSGVRYFINTGTSFEHYGNDADSAVNLYAATKQAFNDLCRYYCDAGFIKAVTLKLFDTYGEDDERKKLLNLLKTIAETGDELLLSPGDQLIDILHISDLMKAYKLVVDQIPAFKSSYSEYGLSNEQRCTLKELVGLVEKITGKQLNIKWGARPYRDREVMVPWKSYASLPGWRPEIALEDGLKRFLNK